MFLKGHRVLSRETVLGIPLLLLGAFATHVGLSLSPTWWTQGLNAIGLILIVWAAWQHTCLLQQEIEPTIMNMKVPESVRWAAKNLLSPLAQRLLIRYILSLSVLWVVLWGAI